MTQYDATRMPRRSEKQIERPENVAVRCIWRFRNFFYARIRKDVSLARRVAPRDALSDANRKRRAIIVNVNV